MPAYVAVYDDTEPALAGARPVAEIHRRLGAPATFCLHTKPLEDDPALARAYKDLLGGDDLIQVLPHTHTHCMMRDHATLGKAAPPEQLAFEIERSIRIIEDLFEKPITGFRGTNGYFNGWKGQPHLLQLMADNGIRYFTSFAMGPGDTVPAPLTEPYFYSEDGFPDLLEIPAHDWHDNVLNADPGVPAAWPPCVPSGLPRYPPTTPREKFEIYRPNMDWTVENDKPHYSPPLHPFAIHRFEPAATWIEMMTAYAMEIGMTPMTMGAFAAQWRAARPNEVSTEATQQENLS